MKKQIEVVMLLDINNKKLSIMGNPSHGVVFKKSNGDFLVGRTANNASCGYWLCNSHIGKKVEVSYHFTKKGNCIIDNIEEAKVQ